MTKQFVPQDYYARLAQNEGYRARSAYKLLELAKKFPLFAPGNRVLDLGAAPGSWLQVAKNMVDKKGVVVGVDLADIEPIDGNVKIIKADVLDPKLPDMLAPYGPFDLILSDLAPSTSGVRTRDQALSFEFAETVLSLANALLAPKGSVVIKIFQGADTSELKKRMKGVFRETKTYKPAASRDRSFETYIVGLGKH